MWYTLARYPYLALCLATAAWIDALNCVLAGHADWPVPALAAVAMAMPVRPAASKGAE